MQTIFVRKESDAGESRVALIPSDAAKLVKANWTVMIEIGAGVKSNFSDADYIKAGAQIMPKEAEFTADFVVGVKKPSIEDVQKRKKSSFHLSFLNPFNEKDLIKAFAQADVKAACFELIPRSTIAQKMDAISSQANLAGYYSVLKGAEKINRVIPMMMTPCGTLSPVKFFIVGVGVAGLQAIATAKRLGGRVEAFDTRPVVEEQVKSLGAKFVKIDLGETGQSAQGYANALTDEQVEKQRAGMAKVCSQADVIITTAKLFDRKAPRIITKSMIDAMKAGSVIIDLAVESGGNVEGSMANQEVVTENGVLILGGVNFESAVASSASQMFSANLYNFIEHFSSKEEGFKVNLEDDIMKSALITSEGQIRDERFA